MAQKEVFLRAFRISTDDMYSSGNILKNLIEVLEKSPTVNDRRLPLNTESAKEDLLSCYSISKDRNQLFCTMVRANLGNEVKSITEDLFREKTFPLSKLQAKMVTGAASIYDFSYYFAVFGDVLITNLPRPHTISSTQTYINWLLNDSRYEITPLISRKQATSLSKIDSLTFDDDFLRKNVITEGSASVLLKTGIIERLKGLFVDASSIEEIDLDQLISAKLVVKFKKSKVNQLVEIQSAYGALLKPISDLDNVTVRTRDNTTLVKGSQLQLSQPVKIGLLENGLLEEPSLFQAMEKFYQSIKKDV